MMLQDVNIKCGYVPGSWIILGFHQHVYHGDNGTTLRILSFKQNIE